MAAPPSAPATGAYFTTQLDSAKDDLRSRGVEVFDFGVGDPIEPTPPFIRQALIDALDPVSQYPSVVGLAPLREALAGWARRRLGVELDPATEVIPTAGSKEGIFHTPLALLEGESRRGMIVPTPGYPVYAASARYSGVPLHLVPLAEESGYRLELGELPRSVLENTRLAWLNYPHNPTGAGVDLSYLERQVEIAREYGIILCSDDCYLDLYFDEENRPPSVLQVTREGVLSFGSLSKRSGMTGYRSGYVAGDAALIERLKKARPNMGVGSPDFVQAAAAVAWADDAHVADRRAIFRAKRDRLGGFLHGKGYRVSPCEGGICLWARVPVPDTDRYHTRLIEHGIIVSPGESFGQGGEGYFRVALVPRLEDLDRAIAVWDTIRF